jgi:hypothetical protein
MAPPADPAPRSTVVALVGADSDALLSGLADVPALAALSLRESDPAVATRMMAAAASPYVVHDADPLEHVAAAWIELYQERATLGTLEIEVETALDAFEHGRALMPDYYIVLDPASADGAWRHWWCGALGQHAPRRVLPAETPGRARDAAIRRMLTALPSSRPWPDPSTWLPGLAFEIPDRVGLRDRVRDEPEVSGS